MPLQLDALVNNGPITNHGIDYSLEFAGTARLAAAGAVASSVVGTVVGERERNRGGDDQKAGKECHFERL